MTGLWYLDNDLDMVLVMYVRFIDFCNSWRGWTCWLMCVLLHLLVSYLGIDGCFYWWTVFISHWDVSIFPLFSPYHLGLIHSKLLVFISSISV